MPLAINLIVFAVGIGHGDGGALATMIMSLIPSLEKLDLSACYFDDQHHALLERSDALINAIASKDRQLVLRATCALREVAQMHFESEEQLMRESQYHSMDRHRASHERLLQSLTQFHEKVVQIEDISGLRDAASFLEQWLVPHLNDDDQLFSQFLAARRYIEAGLPL